MNKLKIMKWGDYPGLFIESNAIAMILLRRKGVSQGHRGRECGGRSRDWSDFL